MCDCKPHSSHQGRDHRQKSRCCYHGHRFSTDDANRVFQKRMGWKYRVWCRSLRQSVALGVA